MSGVGASQVPRVPAYLDVDLPAYGRCRAGGRTALTVGSTSTRASKLREHAAGRPGPAFDGAFHLIGPTAALGAGEVDRAVRAPEIRGKVAAKSVDVVAEKVAVGHHAPLARNSRSM